MRIISKSKDRDYYDGCLAYRDEAGAVFVRNSEYIEPKSDISNVLNKLLPNWTIGTKSNNDTVISFTNLIVVFCGKVYRGIKAERRTGDNSIYSLNVDREEKVFYDYNELAEYLSVYEMELYSSNRWFGKDDRVQCAVQEFLGAQGTDELTEFCVSNRFVTLVGSYESGNHYKGLSWYANGVLKDAQFYKVFDAFTTYQEIDMYVSGTLPQSTAMPINISDKDRINQHGFDKYSFRKPPTKNKK